MRSEHGLASVIGVTRDKNKSDDGLVRCMADPGEDIDRKCPATQTRIQSFQRVTVQDVMMCVFLILLTTIFKAMSSSHCRIARIRSAVPQTSIIRRDRNRCSKTKG